MPDYCASPNLMPLEQAQQQLCSAISAVTETQTIKVEHAYGRVLARQVISDTNVPNHNNSAMDGFAVCDQAIRSAGEVLTQFEVVGTALAGQPYTGQLSQGQAIHIMTGAVVPSEADGVIMKEQTQLVDRVLTIEKPVKPDANVRFAGEDIAKGETVFNANHQLRSVDLGLLASLGVAEVQVLRRVKVAVFSTGDELKQAGETLSEGDIYESNRTVLLNMLKQMHVDVIDLGIIPDDYQAIKQAFLTADEQADIVISSGGVSVGDADFTKQVLAEIGEIGFWKIAIKPGKPFAFGQLPNSWFFGLPGNPVSATVTLDQLARVGIEQCAGLIKPSNLVLTAIATSEIKKRPGRQDFQRGIVGTNSQGELEVSSIKNQSSGVLSSLSKANCYIVLPAESGSVDAGQTVKVTLFADRGL
ncbi:molybdopterin molybdotransferase MoeA [Catenovulum sp. SM1970]|uniref:molybdopterin molybdotransferase MoeA n=1 Tax=Marinifaba aquimaris TaxID=2741323 RepID=UPI0015718E00|nr:gephyrin-like molybdotransferase Glp [Marinifaba aquimaris]NTS76199.1 molybdopterin molybdotransferase MoeA [Marinifaba aquimaris]